jgi:hypothetical protein
LEEAVYYRNRKGRLSPREQAEATNRSHEFVAGSMEPEKAAEYRKLFVKTIPPKRDRVRRPVDGKPAMPLEKEVLADVLQALRNDPRIWIVDRNQSGVFQDGDRYIRVGAKGHLDIKGMLKGGRYMEIECKRPGQRPDDRQAERIERVKKGGGISGYCWSVESALALLP